MARQSEARAKAAARVGELERRLLIAGEAFRLAEFFLRAIENDIGRSPEEKLRWVITTEATRFARSFWTGWKPRVAMRPGLRACVWQYTGS
ncbi:hypothetical protein P7B02_18430 [Caulobacter segnis]|uniref:hypothetical protein n=1 Tax=Caulobacter segnis TaxID=88688 RepID=UPI00240FDE42|nr:hypothetical protein [Caulobacter segnis]MDG2523510.1 hypothetical protein [Caulobacter segnis]